MKSSSKLFPVRLLQAGLWGDLSEDIYLVKHNRDKDKTVEIAVSRLGRADVDVKYGFPVILLHGSFTNKGFWLSAKGHGFARYLVEQGFDVWMMEQRGHGYSPANANYVRNTVEDYALYDLPAVHDFVYENTGQSAAWVGHSLGGTSIATAIAADTFSKPPAAFALLGTQVVRPVWYLQIPLFSQIAQAFIRAIKVLEGKKIKIGPENEPAGVINEYLARHALFGKWKFVSQDTDLNIGWRQAEIPMLGVSAEADTQDPAKYCETFYSLYGGERKLLRLGKKNGFIKDYGHIDMIVSKEAQQDVWPAMSDWLKKYVAD